MAFTLLADRGTQCGLRPTTDTLPCIRRSAPDAGAPKDPLTIWLKQPIARTDNAYIDQTYRYGSTMGGFFQQHQGVEFNNPDGTTVMAALGGKVVYAGRAEEGANTIAIRHDTTVKAQGKTLRLYSIYYHNSSLAVKVGDRVKTGQVIARVGNTGRALPEFIVVGDDGEALGPALDACIREGSTKSALRPERAFQACGLALLEHDFVASEADLLCAQPGSALDLILGKG